MESPQRCVKEGEPGGGEQEGRGRGCMDLTGYGTYRHPDCALLSSFFGGEDKRKKGGNRKKGPGIRVS